MKVSGALVSWVCRFRGAGCSLSKVRSFMAAAGVMASSFHGFWRPSGHDFRFILEHFVTFWCHFGDVLATFRALEAPWTTILASF